MKLAPIAIFAFNRPSLLQLSLDALAANELAGQSHVTFFCDGPRDSVKYPEDKTKCAEVRTIARAARGFASVEVVEREQNLGCADSIIAGLTQMFANHGRLIVIEDDILTSPYTLSFLNEGLRRYDQDNRVFNISAWSLPSHLLPPPKGYAYDVYSVPRFNCWGWASWRNRFESIDWEVKNFSEVERNIEIQRAYCSGGEDMYPMLVAQMRGAINSWAIRADWWRFCQGQVGLQPFNAYSTNIGFGSGVHTTVENHAFDNDINKALELSSVRWVPTTDLETRLVYAYKLGHDSLTGNGRIKRLVRKVLQAIGLLPLARLIKRCLNLK